VSSLLVILIGTVLVNTFLLLHDDPALFASHDRDLAPQDQVARGLRIAGATAVALVTSSTLTAVVWSFLPSLPGDVALYVFALSVVALTFVIDAFARRYVPHLARALAISPLLVIGNSLALGTTLLTAMTASILRTFGYAVALGIGFAITLAIFVGLIARIDMPAVPAPFRGAPIILISAGLLALALMGLSGIV